MRYFRVLLELGHWGSGQSTAETWHVATHATAADVMSNAGHLLPGVKRVLEVHTITEAEWQAARQWGQQAMALEVRR